MKHCHIFGCFASTVLLCLMIVGCEKVPASVAQGERAAPNLVSQSSDNVFDWPVAGGAWQVSRPTSIACLRQLEPGALGKRFAEIQAQRQQRIDAAKNSSETPPWQVDGHEISAKNTTWMKEILNEVDNQLQQESVVKIPAKVASHHLSDVSSMATRFPDAGFKIQLDYFGRRMVVLNDSIWLCRLPWRDYYASPSTPPQENDEPGTPDVFDKIELSNATDGVPVLAEFYGDGAMMIAAKGKSLYTIDCDKQAVIAETDVGNSIVHLDVAFETGDAIVVDSVGKIHLLNRLLKQVVHVGECDLELPMPVISPEAARIAMYESTDTGRVYKIEDLVVLEQFDVALVDAAEPLAIRSGRRYDLWIEKNAVHKRANDPNTPGTDRNSYRASIYWDIQDVIDRHALPTGHSQFTVAKRAVTGADGNVVKEWVAFDGVLGNRLFYQPLPLPDLTDKQITASGLGTRVCIASEQEAAFYYRNLKFTTGVSGVYSFARNYAWNTDTALLEKAAMIISSLPGDRHDRRPQQIYSDLVRGITEIWSTANYRMDAKDDDRFTEQDRQEAKEVIAKLTEWAKKKSALAIASEMTFRSAKAWSARGHGYSSTVSRDGWQVFENENQKALKLWKEIEPRDDIPACAFAQFIQLGRDTGMEYNDVSDQLARAMNAYPIEDEFHHEMMFWLLEKWGGSRGSSSAYAAAVGDAIGSQRGDFVYSRLMTRIAPNYPAGFFYHAQVDRGRVLRGIRYGIQTRYWQEVSTIQSMRLLSKSTSGPGATSDQTYLRQVRLLMQELADYYKSRYPMLYDSAANNNETSLVQDYLAK